MPKNHETPCSSFVFLHVKTRGLEPGPFARCGTWKRKCAVPKRRRDRGGQDGLVWRNPEKIVWFPCGAPLKHAPKRHPSWQSKIAMTQSYGEAASVNTSSKSGVGVQNAVSGITQFPAWRLLAVSLKNGWPIFSLRLGTSHCWRVRGRRKKRHPTWAAQTVISSFCWLRSNRGYPKQETP